MKNIHACENIFLKFINEILIHAIKKNRKTKKQINSID